jgi:hypothetical protein
LANDNLDKNAKEILAYAEREGFNIFYADPEGSGAENSSYFAWDKSKDWKDFFKVAKKEGVSTIVAMIAILEKDSLQELKEAMEDERQNPQEITNKDDLDALTDVLSRLAKQTGKTGFYSFVWLKDGLEYSLTDSADWYNEVKDILKDRKLLERIESGVATSRLAPSSFSSERSVPAFLKDKTEDELVKDMIEFILEESKSVANIDNYNALSSMFWSKNGVERFIMPGEARYLIQKVDMKASQQIEAMQIEKEKEEMPKLVDECYDWCKENDLSKLIKTHVSAFLAEKGISLSSHGKDLLYQKVNMKLRSS